VVQAWRDAGRREKPHFSGSCLFALGPDAKAQLDKSLFDLVGPQNADYAREAIESSNNYGEVGLRNAVDGARLAGLDDFILMPTTADPEELDRACDVIGI